MDKRRKKGWYGAGLITCDLGLVVSNDGITFREPVTDSIYISGQQSPVTSVPGVLDPTILCQANGILNVGDKTLIYHGRWRNATSSGKDYYAEVALATLPRDRWGRLHLAAGAPQGTVWSTSITIPKGGCNISLNADRAENLTVELTGEEGKLLPAYSGESKGVIKGTSANVCSVLWADRKLSNLGGKVVRLKLGIADDNTNLYAVTLETPNEQN